MEHLIFNPDTMEFRYAAGTPVYSERLENGRLIASDFLGGGMPLNKNERLGYERSVSAFELEVDGCDASFGWKFAGRKTSESSDGRGCAELTLQNPARGLRLRVVTLCGGDGFLTRKLYLKNETGRTAVISKAEPLCLPLWEQQNAPDDRACDYRTPIFSVGSYFGRDWGTEGMFRWNQVPYNTAVEIGSYAGKSGHGHPLGIVRNEVYGGYFLCQMEWSTSWRMQFRHENDFQGGHISENNRLIFSAGLPGPAPLRVMEDGEEVLLPPVHFGLCFGTFDRLIQNLHSYQRKHLLARPAGGHEWVSYDGWGYHGSDYKEDILFREIDRAAELGCEVYMVDAGWYGKAGTDWASTVGDWSTGRLPHDLFPIIEHAHEKGMKFGLWMEPESLGLNSQCYREHPDWLIDWYGHSNGRCLNLARPEVEEWVYRQVADVVCRYDLDLFRIDFNVPFTNGQQPNQGYTENILWRYNDAIHRIFDRIRALRPGMVLENCSSGGGRTDLGMMSRFSKTQISDWFRLPRAPRTILGMSLCLPPECLLMQYGSAIDAYRTGSADIQLQTTFIGVPKISGIAPIDEPVNPALSEQLKRYIRLYKAFIRPIQERAVQYLHTPDLFESEQSGWAVAEFAAPERDRAYIYAARLPDSKASEYRVRAKGVDPSGSYRVTLCSADVSFTLSGPELVLTGIPVTADTPLNSELILIERV